MIQLATMAQLGGGTRFRPPLPFDFTAIMIVDHLLSDFAVKEKNTKTFLCYTRVSNLCLFCLS